MNSAPPDPYAAFLNQLLDTVREQTDEMRQLRESSIRNETVLAKSVEQSAEALKGLGALKSDFEQHRQDAVTWSKLGKGFAVVASALGVISGVVTALSKFNII